MISQSPFSTSDFACPCARCRLSKRTLVPANPQLIAWANTVRLVLNDSGYKARITSGVRCVEHNREVGGAPLSKHLTGEACDISASSAMAWLIVKTLMTKTECYFIEVAPMHVHFDCRQLPVAGAKLITGNG